MNIKNNSKSEDAGACVHHAAEEGRTSHAFRGTVVLHVRVVLLAEHDGLKLGYSTVGELCRLWHL